MLRFLPVPRSNAYLSRIGIDKPLFIAISVLHCVNRLFFEDRPKKRDDQESDAMNKL